MSCCGRGKVGGTPLGATCRNCTNSPSLCRTAPPLPTVMTSIVRRHHLLSISHTRRLTVIRMFQKRYSTRSCEHAHLYNNNILRDYHPSMPLYRVGQDSTWINDVHVAASDQRIRLVADVLHCIKTLDFVLSRR